MKTSSLFPETPAPVTDPPLKWHGGKHYLAKQIIELFPPSRLFLHYVEPFAGGLAVLLARDPEGTSEVVNDISEELTTFWRTLACPVQFPRFLRLSQATPFSEATWQDEAPAILDSWRRGDDSACQDEALVAWAFFVLCRQSLAGRMKSFTGITKTRTRRGMNNEVSAWLTAVDGLPAVHARLKRVMILNRDALDVIRQQDGTQTLFYLDPPYLHETRSAPNVYRHEMAGIRHVELLDLLNTLKAKVILSGYRSDLYDAKLANWTRHDFDLPNHSAGGKAKRRMTECVWLNY